ncbi:putative tricarboxylic transport membrane protein [Dongia mobilis]|uniref:Putative tricarboxylic transport membrane protein n=1 Tax=Dongia mobilis TaxID=578943 RepID=A0A4R6WWF4_9PROT|nr:tripartite tricarboxylate transporter substrate binding protein [Dongia mobilis]TDQ86423.1 putative tricarboxylic transport membrane protein [Dongia mobilis]
MNELTRRQLMKSGVALSTLATLGTLLPQAALALDELTVIAPAAPGGGWDQTARSIQEVLQTSGIVKAVQVDNVPGAGGTVGLAQFANSKGDASKLLVGGLVMVGAILTNKSPVTLKDVTPLARLTGEYEVVVVPAASELNSMADLVAKLKADPGSVSWGGGSAGGTDHILCGLIAKAGGADVTKVNYIAFSGGGEALAAIVGGHVTAGVSGIGEFEAQIKAGELRALAISSPERLPGLDAPTLMEQGLDVELANWRGIFAAGELADGDRQALLDVIDQMVKSDGWKNILSTRGWMDVYLAGDDFASYLTAEDERITAILKEIGLVS